MVETIFWFRKDLRLRDNPGLYEASKFGKVIPVYILDPEENMGRANLTWLDKSLEALKKDLDGKLTVYMGRAQDVISKLLDANPNVRAIHSNRCYEPWRIKSDGSIKDMCAGRKVDFVQTSASLLRDPEEVVNNEGGYYKVYTPFKNALLRLGVGRKVLPEPANLLLGASNLPSNYKFKQEAWQGKILTHWKVGEAAARARLNDFVRYGLDGYKVGRDFPNKNHVSRLSPHLHFGEISPHQVLSVVETANAPKADSDHFISEIIWREFSYYLLYYFPKLPSENFNSKFNSFPWHKDKENFVKWTKGETGCPIVDAGMRQLWETGYIHNRIRMIAASFLVKNLLIDWREGAAWFWDCLVDGDLANNSASWQWVAGSGADAAPYFRIFSPALQTEKFDPTGEYIKTWVPELKESSSKELSSFENLHSKYPSYPKLIVDLEKSRQIALGAYKEIK